MSGGSLNYISQDIDNLLVGSMEDAELDDLMADIVKLSHDLEWYLSGDTVQNDYRESVKQFKNKWFKQSREQRLVGYVDKKIDNLKNELYLLIDEDDGIKARR